MTTPTQTTISGIVLDQGTKERLNGVTIRLETPTGVFLEETDENGEFTFKNVEAPDIKEEKTYPVSLFAYDKGGRKQVPTPITANIVSGEASQFHEINMVSNRGPISNEAGKAFLAFLIVLFVALAVSYYYQHKPNGKGDPQKNNPKLVNLHTESLVERITYDSVTVSSINPDSNQIDSIGQLLMTARLQQLKGATAELFKSTQVDSTYEALVYLYLEDINQAIENKDKKSIQTALLSTRSKIQDVPSLAPSWFWNTPPFSYYEILFWALFATLLRLINNTGYYISRNNFLRDSILQKAALLVSIPLIALMITFVISFFKISITFGGPSIEFDFSNPYFSIILASLIGLAPWKSWKFMYGLADELFKKLQSWLGLIDDEDDKEIDTDKKSKVPATNPTTIPETPNS